MGFSEENFEIFEIAVDRFLVRNLCLSFLVLEMSLGY